MTGQMQYLLLLEAALCFGFEKRAAVFLEKGLKQHQCDSDGDVVVEAGSNKK